MIDYEGLTATQVAARLQCSEQSIRLWVKKRGSPVLSAAVSPQVVVGRG